MSEATLENARDLWFYFWVAAHVLGAVVLAQRRRFDLLGLLVSPLLVLLMFNQLGRWPLKGFRVNLFLLAYYLPVASFAFDGIIADRRRWVSWPGRVAIVGALCLPTLVFGFEWHNDKRFWTTSTNMGAVLDAMQKRREAVLAKKPDAPIEEVLFDSYACGPGRYYFNLDAKSRRDHGEFFDANFKLRCVGSRLRSRAAHQRKPYWVVLARGRKPNAKAAATVKRVGRVVYDEEVFSRRQRLLYVKPKGKKAHKPKRRQPERKSSESK